MPFGHLRSSLEQGSLGLGPRSIEQVGQVNQVGNYLERPSSHTQKPQGGPEAVPSPSSKKVGLTHLPSEPAAPKERARTEANVAPSGVTLNTACNSSEAVFSFKPCGQLPLVLWMTWNNVCGHAWETGMDGVEPQTPSAISPPSSEPAGAGAQVCQLPARTQCPG